MAKVINIKEQQDIKKVYSYVEYVGEQSNTEEAKEFRKKRDKHLRNIELSWIEEYDIDDTDRDICYKALDLIKDNLTENPLENIDSISDFIDIPLYRLLQLSKDAKQVSTPFYDEVGKYVWLTDKKDLPTRYKFYYDNREWMVEEIKEAFVKDDADLYANAEYYLFDIVSLISTLKYYDKADQIERSQH